MNRGLFLFSLLLAGCTNQLSGSVDGESPGAFAEAVYFELRYVDEGIDQHDLAVWLMPMEDSCSVFPTLLADLTAARAAIDEESLEPQTYCDRWEGIWAEHLGNDAFWMAQYSLRARPRPADREVVGDYPWLSRSRLNDDPVFDADLARYPAPDFAACAEEFEGNATYAPTVHAATEGLLEVRTHTTDEALTGTARFTVEASDGDGLNGGFDATFCPAAAEWPIVFGLGL